MYPFIDMRWLFKPLSYDPMNPPVICLALRRFYMFTFVVSLTLCSNFVSIKEGKSSGFLVG